LGVISGAALACKNGKVIAAGRAEEVEAEVAVDDSNVLDAGGRVVAPGFVDAHTHLVFAGWRAAEYGMRSEGRSYLEIAAAKLLERCLAGRPYRAQDSAAGSR